MKDIACNPPPCYFEGFGRKKPPDRKAAIIKGFRGLSHAVKMED